MKKTSFYTVFKNNKRGNLSRLSEMTGISRTSCVKILNGEWYNEKVMLFATQILETNKAEITAKETKKTEIVKRLKAASAT